MISTVVEPTEDVDCTPDGITNKVSKATTLPTLEVDCTPVKPITFAGEIVPTDDVDCTPVKATSTSA